jgi:toxin-antitoxin system PIN domain toxin
MRALFDVNALLGLIDADHIFNERIRAWWSANNSAGWATCPLTENGFTRIISQRSYPQRRTVREAALILAPAAERPSHQFWADNISITDIDIFDHSRILGPGQITDVYLLALAVKHGGRLVTFDRGIPIHAVRRAEPRHLVVL